ncbi:MAG TPA: pyruvate kinase alpha/beta domain-containing protein [Dehalococcoidales bacterium]|nr:pyruvate kinase alpha/beta domain-containing protein [Dehalococcoidales bacterium]
MEEKIVYFDEAGIENTETTLRLAAERAKARGIKKVILASTRGDTARLAARLWAGNGIKMVVVPHQYGFMAGQRFPAELVSELTGQGHAVHFGTMLFHTENLYGMDTPRTMANLLRTFCQGMKVCVEIIFMAVDGGKVAPGEEVVVVTGTGRGADTAIVAIAAPSTRLPDLHITEIICKPLQTRQGPPPPMPPPEKKS